MKHRRVIYSILLLLTFSFSILFYSCSDDSNPAKTPDPVTQQLVFLDTAYAIGGQALVSFYVEDTLHVGYNNVYLVIHDSITGNLITDAHIEFNCTDHGYGTPVEDPPQTAVDGKFKGAMILNESQANDDPLHWHYDISVHNHQAPGKPEGIAAFRDFRVKENPDQFREITMPGTDSVKLYLANIKPVVPVSGLNDFEFIINRDEPDLFPPDGSFTIQLNPVYISDTTGHTTTGNVNPVGSSDGHYNGKLNFDRSGKWRINMRISKNGTFYDTFFDMTY